MPGLIVLALLGPVRSAMGQETGKVQGRISDAASGQPIAGAQVVILGTRLGNITNADGFYFINNVPAGLQDIQAQYIGYQTVTVRQTRVLAGQTLTQNFQLQTAAVQIAALEVLGEQRPLVPRDQVATKNIVTGENVDELPVDNVVNIIRLQPGVVQSGRKDGVSIRGGRSGEEAVFVDGVLVRNFNRGGSNLTIGTNSLSEVDVLTGGFSAEYGEAQSGIINYVSRSGGRKWNGTASITSDEMMPKKYSVGFNRAELSFGGPITTNLGFFAAATATGQKSADFGREWRNEPIYVAQGIDTVISYDLNSNDVCAAASTSCRDVSIPNFVQFENGTGRIPYSNADGYTLDSKVDYSYGSGSRISLSGKMSRNQGRSPNGFGGGKGSLYNSQGFTGALGKSQVATLGWTHNFVRTSESALSLDLKISRQLDHNVGGNLDPSFDLAHRDPAFGFTMPDFRFQVDPRCNSNDSGCIPFTVDQSLVDKYMHNTITTPTVSGITPYPTSRTDLNASTEYRLNPYGILGTTFATRGVGGVFNYTDEDQWQFRGTVDWQINRQNRMKFGGDFLKLDIARAAIAYNNASFAYVFIEHPNRGSVFVQDRLDLGDVVVEGGLRYDRFDPKSDFPVTPGYFDPENPATFFAAPIRTALSPRLGVSFPITVNSTFRMSYGHFVQTPDLNNYYWGKNTDYFRFHNTNTNDFFSQPLDFAKTVSFEFGYRQLLASDFVLDISAYNKDKLKDVTLRKLAWTDPTNPTSSTYLNTFTNADFGEVRGIDVRLDRRFGQVFDGMVGYSYQDARDTGTDPFTFTNIFARLESNANVLLGLPPNPAQAVRVTEENRKHNITGNFSLQWPSNFHNKLLANFGIFTTARILSGLSYSPLTVAGTAVLIAGQAGNAALGVTASQLQDNEINTARMPWQKFIDMKAQKGLKLMGLNAQVFADARNIFDIKNQIGVFQTSGDVVDERVYANQVQAHRETVGGGTPQPVLNLTSLGSAGAGVRNAVDLYLLQQAECRFGNCDMQFSAEEQTRAFRAASVFLNGPQDLFASGRRIRLGFELAF